MSETFQVVKREKTGKANNRRLRGAGLLPAILYGHGKESISLSVPEDQLLATLRHGAKVVELKGDVAGQALLQEIQWDVFRKDVLHVDLLRVEAGDTVKVEVPLQIRGEAPGEHEGGVVELLIRSVEIQVAPSAVPDTLHINVNHLALGQSLTLDAIEDLPGGAVLTGDSSLTAVHCIQPSDAPEAEESLGGGPAEPQVIGRDGKEASDDDA